MQTPLCPVSGLAIEEGCPAVAYVVVRGRTDMGWSPLGFGFHGLQSGTRSMSGVEDGPLADRTRKALLKGLRRRDGTAHGMPHDIDLGEVVGMLAEDGLRWDSARTSGSFEEHRIRVMQVRDDVHAPLVSDMADTDKGREVVSRVMAVVGVMREMAAVPRGADGRPLDDTGMWAAVDALTKAWKAMGPHSTLLGDNQPLAGGPHEAALVGAVVELCLFEAALEAVGSAWRPSRVAVDAPDRELVARHHANVLRIVEGA